MEFVVANVDGIKFDIEVALEQQLGAEPLPFNGMDKSTSAICVFFIEGSCTKGSQCPFRHVRGDRTIVCKHWLRGLCKKGDQCEFLHEFDMTKMPECYFYTRFNACHNKECPFLHIDPESKVRPCPWYDRGFCRHGPNCRHRHVRKVLCLNYVAGFCPDGAECKFVHAQFELPQVDEVAKNARKAGIICHICGEAGHKSYQCPKNSELMDTSEGKRNDENMDGHEQGRSQGHGIPVSGGSGPNPGRMLSENSHHSNHPPSGNPNMPMPPRGGGFGRPGEFSVRAGQYMTSTDHGAPPSHQYQPYQFHPRPMFPKPHREANRERDENTPRRNIEDVVCYKCGYKGHYANKCNKGHLAFLSHKAGPNTRDASRNN